jgi:hypothetical protein
MTEKQPPTLSPKEAAEYVRSTDWLVARSMPSTAPGACTWIKAPRKHRKQVQEWADTHAFPGRFSRYDDDDTQCDLCGEWTSDGICRCYRGA